MADVPYPAAPLEVPRDLTAPTREHKKRLVLGLVGLALFVLVYLGLTYELFAIGLRTVRRFDARGQMIWGVVVAAPAFFLGAFLVRGIFAVKKTADPRHVELKREEEPVLFAFIDRVATDAGAPKPHRVFVAPEVNAAVFYDLSFWNLLFPTKKNLLIGLGLVNSLSLDEMKAVLGHEFGHFAQRSMRVGSYVYVAWQIVRHVVATRGSFDTLVNAISRIDIRIAWIGWALALVLWSIRSVLDTMFRGLLVLERALSREMEFQADLVAVTISGSDSLVHALSRLGSADEAWDTATSFGLSETQRERTPEDLYEVQSKVLEHFRAIRRKPALGRTPPLGDASSRVFPIEIVLPPRMWATHPPNRDREENAKRRYVASALDDRSAWILFRDPAAIRRSTTRHLLKTLLEKDPPEAVPTAETNASLDDIFGRRRHLPRYHGLYLDRSIVRTAIERSALVSEVSADVARNRLAALYPDSLATDLDRWREIEREHALLEALKRGALEAPGGVIRVRGEEIGRRELDRVVDSLEAEVRAARERLAAHDRETRSVHRAAAALVGNAWPEHLEGLLDVLFYADHQAAALTEAAGHFTHVLQIATADGRVSSSEMDRLLQKARVAHDRLMEVYDRADEVVLSESLLAERGAESWKASLGEPKIPSPTRELFAQGWVPAFFSWVGAATSHLEALGNDALDALLEAEDRVAAAIRDGADPGTAPAPCRAPATHATLLEGTSGKWKEELGWWNRFQLAQGWGAGAARLALASVVLGGGLLFAAGSLGHAKVVVQNGLLVPVHVDIAGQRIEVGPLAHLSVDVPLREVRVEAVLADGTPLEAFDQDLSGTGWDTQVYNVVRASVLEVDEIAYGDWTPGPPRTVGAPRWYESAEADVLDAPPTSVETSASGMIRRVLRAVNVTAYENPVDNLGPEEAAVVAAAHLRHDPPGSTTFRIWVEIAPPDVALAIIRERLALAPDDVDLARMEMHAAGPEAKAEICRSREAAAAADPTNADRAYLAIRCRDRGPEQDAAFLAAHAAHPDNRWLAWSAGWAHAHVAEWTAAWPLLESSVAAIESAELLGPDILRVQRMATRSLPDAAQVRAVLGASSILTLFLDAERDPASVEGALPDAPPSLRATLYTIMGRIPEAQAVEGLTDEEKAELAWRIAVAPAATREQIDAALAAPHVALHGPVLEAAIALCTREGRPVPETWRTEAEANGSPLVLLDREALLADPTIMDRTIASTEPRNRGTALLMGVVVLRDLAPARWRDEARLLLLPHERPRLD
jgi:Zn-dependent protease with chaperone function